MMDRCEEDKRLALEVELVAGRLNALIVRACESGLRVAVEIEEKAAINQAGHKAAHMKWLNPQDAPTISVSVSGVF